MGDMVEGFRLMKEQAKKIRQEKEPNRFEYATDLLMNAGHRVGLDPTDDSVLLVNGSVKLWPYKGWWSGKGVGSGRGVQNLVKALAPKETN